MVPEFDVKQIDTRLSSDIPSHIYTWLIILSMVGFFVLRGGFGLADIVKFVIIIGLISFQSVSRFIPGVNKLKTFSSGGLAALLIYNVALDLLFILLLPLFSPFILIIPAVMYITIYYRGISSYLISMFSLVAVVVIVSLRGISVDPHILKFFPYLTIILGVAYGGIIQRASTIEAKVRSEFNRVSQKVSQERQQLSSLINSIGETAVAIDAHGIILFYNAGALSMLNTNASLSGRPISEHFVLRDKAGQIIDPIKLMSGRHSFSSRDLALVTGNNEKMNLSVEINPIRSDYSKWQQEGYILLLRDITKEKTLDEERDEFVSVTSHELRTPIAIAEANLSTALATEAIKNVDAKSKKLLDQTYKTILSLGDLVSDLSLLTQAETVGLSGNGEKVNVAQLLYKTVHNFDKKAAEKSLSLQLDAAEDMPELITNKFYLGKIIESFISNAIKYTPDGSVVVGAAEAQDGDGIIISVRDTGIGIGQSDKPHLFQKFYRSEDYKIRETGGTGLGLYIVLKLSSYIQGKVWFESTLGQGSTFYIQVKSLATPTSHQITPEASKTQSKSAQAALR